jgi:hypothetical protein
VLKQEKMSPMKPLSIIWYIACVRTSACFFFFFSKRKAKQFRFNKKNFNFHQKRARAGVGTDVRRVHGDVWVGVVPAHHPDLLAQLHRETLLEAPQRAHTGVSDTTIVNEKEVVENSTWPQTRTRTRCK